MDYYREYEELLMNLDCAEMSMDWMSDAVSRFIQSPSYLQPLLEFIDENCSVFEDKEANKLEYTVVILVLNFV